MRKEIKDRWVEALRSGEYQQGQGTLKHGESFCCDALREHNYASCEHHGNCPECARIEAQAETRAEDRWAESRMEPYDTDGCGGYTWWEPRA